MCGQPESMVPFCGVAILETLVGEKGDVVDPALELFEDWQPNSRQCSLQREIMDEMAAALNSPFALRPQ
jgi:hypothetical protein